MQIWQTLQENKKLIDNLITYRILSVKIILYQEIYFEINKQQLMNVKRHDAVLNLSAQLNISSATIYRALKFMETEVK